MTGCILCAVKTTGLDPDLPQILKRMPSLRLQKLARLRRKEDRQRSICAELALQAAFALAGLAPLNYTIGSNGRPELPGSLDLSISHAGEYGAAVLAPMPVGLDLEEKGRSLARIRKRICSREELGVTDGELVRLWTAKEAYLKLTGEGLRMSMTRLSLRDDLVLRDSAADARILLPKPPRGYTAAIATRVPTEAEVHILDAETAMRYADEQQKEHQWLTRTKP